MIAWVEGIDDDVMAQRRTPIVVTRLYTGPDGQTHAEQSDPKLTGNPAAKTFGTDRIRCFDFWRLDNVAPYRVAINEKLREAARRCARSPTSLTDPSG